MKTICCGEDATTSLPVNGDEALARLAQALGHPARVAIVRLLLKRKACVCGEIVGTLPLAQSTVSQHLKILKDAGWICGAIIGPRVCYCVHPDAAETFARLFQALKEDAHHDTRRTETRAGRKPRKSPAPAAARKR